MKLDSDTKEVVKSLIEDGFFNPRTYGIDVSKFLDSDKQLDLWLLEVAIRNSIKFVHHATGSSISPMIEGLNEYYILRDIVEDWEKVEEETEFILMFFQSIFEDEISTG